VREDGRKRAGSGKVSDVGESTTATEDIDEPPPSSADESDSRSHFHFPRFGCGGGHGFEYRRNNIVIRRVFALRDLRADEDIVLG